MTCTGRRVALMRWSALLPRGWRSNSTCRRGSKWEIHKTQSMVVIVLVLEPDPCMQTLLLCMWGSGSKTKRLHVEKTQWKISISMRTKVRGESVQLMRTKVRASSNEDEGESVQQWGQRWECSANAESQRNVEKQGQENLPLKWYQLWKQSFAGWEAFSYQGRPKKLCGGVDYKFVMWGVENYCYKLCHELLPNYNKALTMCQNISS